MSKNVTKIMLSVVLISGALGYLLSTSIAEEIEYFHPADAVIARSTELTGQRIRMGGHVLKDSIFQKKGTLEYQFDVRPIPGMVKHKEAADKTLVVRYVGVVPDTFKDDAEVVVTGSLGADGVFHGTDLLAKCPSKYEAAEKEKGTY